ncbi:Anticodon-binding domain protein [Dictyocaulus viviparus]|uniref:Anticodon-binding domain protein n=1 Tax=Dictyocaulus viviparus TaxID=29172 RepID=A0A0D8Y7J1_DICVI|nr:Anticodon-binding domain protein [Dictyocaulus viviparus]
MMFSGTMERNGKIKDYSCERLEPVRLPVLARCYVIPNNRSSFTMNEVKSENVMDRWIESFTNSLVQFVRNEMSEYRLYAVVNPLTRFFDTLTNCYIRLNRKRIKGDFGIDDQTHALSALGRVLVLIVRLMSPFTPFFSEYIWQRLRNIIGAPEESVHFTLLPTSDNTLIDEVVERRVQAMRDCIDLVRVSRERKGIPVKYPLKEIIVVNRNSQFLEDVKSLEQYILSEVNVRQLTISQDKKKYGIMLKADPNFRALGARLKGDQKKVVDYLKNEVTDNELEQFLIEGVLFRLLTVEMASLLYLDMNLLQKNSVSVTQVLKAIQTVNGYETNSDGKTIVMLDVSEDSLLVEEGLAREITNRVQKLRKTAKLISTDPAIVYCTVRPEASKITEVLMLHKERIEEATGTPIFLEALPSNKSATATNVSTIKDAEVSMWLVAKSAANVVTVSSNGNTVSIKLTSNSDEVLSYRDLLYEIRSALDLWEGNVSLTLSNGTRFHPTTPVEELSGQTVTVQT